MTPQKWTESIWNVDCPHHNGGWYKRECDSCVAELVKKVIVAERERCVSICDEVTEELRNPLSGLDYGAVLVKKRILGIKLTSSK